MKCKIVLAGLLSITMLASPAISAFGDDAGKDVELAPISAPLEDTLEENYLSITGTVVGIRDHTAEGSKFISIGTEDAITANVIVSKDTYIVDEGEITVGSKITWFYDANKPMIMIYPPQYSAEKVIVEGEGEVVLRKEGDPTDEGPGESWEATVDIGDMDIVVDDKKVTAPPAYSNEEGVPMIPLRAVAEALGFDVEWNDGQKSVRVGNAISLKIGEDNYILAKMTPIELGTAPELVEGTTFVPLSFFKEVVRVNNAYVFEGQIDINDGELMY